MFNGGGVTSPIGACYLLPSFKENRVKHATVQHATAKHAWLGVLMLVLAASGEATRAAVPAARQNPAAAVRSAAGPGILTGTVRRNDTREPIEGVEITINSLEDGDRDSPVKVYSAVTDGAGRFSVAGLPLGPYTITAQRAGYFGVYPAGTTPSATASSFLDDQRPAQDVPLELLPGGSIHGRIFDAAGRPLANVQVTGLLESFADGHPR